MFGNVFDWIWMTLAVAIGMACAKYVPMIVTKILVGLGKGLDKVNRSNSDA